MTSHDAAADHSAPPGEKSVTPDSVVLFRNASGLAVRGTFLNISRNSVVFEVYNPYSIVQLSEVLHDLEVRRRDLVIYRGRAMVSNLVSTGLMLIVTAALVDPWSDLATASPAAWRQEAINFVADWEADHHLLPDFQLTVSTFSHFLSELSRWIQQAELALQPEPVTARIESTAAGTARVTQSRRDEDQRRQLTRELLGEITAGVGPKLAELFQRFEQAATRIPDELQHIHRAFARRELHPLMMCSPFMHRTYTKPLGYAGDYEMVNMLVRDPAEGPNIYAMLLNTTIIGAPTGQAHRNRIGILHDHLRRETLKAAAAGRRLRVLNLGCGPAEEVYRFIRDGEVADACDLDLLDFNEETLAWTRERLTEVAQAQRSRIRMQYLHRSIHAVLKEASRRSAAPPPQYDLVYCAGLFDYLSDRVCGRLVDLFCSWTAPAGMVLVTNVHNHNPIRQIMEHLLEWHLIYRDEASMAALAPPGPARTVFVDETGVNVFMTLRLPDGDAGRA